MYSPTPYISTVKVAFLEKKSDIRTVIQVWIYWDIMNYYPLFRVRSWNNGMRCMSLYSLIRARNVKWGSKWIIYFQLKCYIYFYSCSITFHIIVIFLTRRAAKLLWHVGNFVVDLFSAFLKILHFHRILIMDEKMLKCNYILQITGPKVQPRCIRQTEVSGRAQVSTRISTGTRHFASIRHH